MKKVKLGEICEIKSGGTPSRANMEYWNDGNIPWVKISDIKEKYLRKTEEFITQQGLENSSAKIFKKRTIIYTIFATLGEVSILDIEASTNQAIAGLQIIDKNVYQDYLYYFLISLKGKVNDIGRGGAQNNINLSILKNFEIPLPSLEEQKAIADRLDKVSSLIEKRKTQLSKLDQLIKSRFIEMFGDPVDNDKDWKTDELQNVISINKYKGKVDLINNKVWLLNLDMIESNTGEILDYVYENEEDVPNSTIKFNNNSVLYSKLRPYLNKVVIPTKCGYATSELVSMNPNSLINKYFLAGLLRYESFVNFANGTAYGAKMPRASVDEIKKFRLILPPIELQNQFATFVEQTDRAKLVIQKSIDKLETLKKSLMQQYFG